MKRKLKAWPYGISIVVVFLFLVLQSPRVARANDIPVGCSAAELIDAIHAANVTVEADTLELAAGCTYTLTQVNNTDDPIGPTGLPIITSAITIHGNDAAIERAAASRVRLMEMGMVSRRVTLARLKCLRCPRQRAIANLPRPFSSRRLIKHRSG